MTKEIEPDEIGLRVDCCGDVFLVLPDTEYRINVADHQFGKTFRVSRMFQQLVYDLEHQGPRAEYEAPCPHAYEQADDAWERFGVA